MLIVEPVQEKDEQERLCKKCGVDYIEEAMAYSAWVDGELVGICQFGYKTDGGHIYCLRAAVGTDDANALFIMGRQTMNFIDLTGQHEVWYDETVEPSKNFSKLLGFREKDGKLWANLEGFFDHPCEHGKASSATE